MRAITSTTRPPHDDISFNWFHKIIQNIPDDISFQAFYLWGGSGEQLPINIQTPNIILGLKDLLDYDDGYSRHLLDKIKNVVRNHTDTQFIFLSSVLNLDKILADLPNAVVIYWGGDFINQQMQYSEALPPSKNISSDKNFLAIARSPKQHRVLLLAYLLEKNLQNSGIMKFSYLLDSLDDSELISSMIPWDFSPFTNIDNLDCYFLKAKELIDQEEKLPDYVSLNKNDNFENFITNLKLLYENTFVEIVCETSFTSLTTLLTEKTFHTFYGMSFPIILCSPGIISSLRSVGFDMFDDVIDHSYDLELNPAHRIFKAISNNLEILSNNALVKQKWKNCEQRFLNNFKHAQQIHIQLEKEVMEKIQKIQWRK